MEPHITVILTKSFKSFINNLTFMILTSIYFSLGMSYHPFKKEIRNLKISKMILTYICIMKPNSLLSLNCSGHQCGDNQIDYSYSNLEPSDPPTLGVD